MEKCKVAIYGMGLLFPVVFKSIDRGKCEITAIIDNDPIKIGTNYNGIRILPITQVDRKCIDYICVTSEKHFLSISESCIKVGFQESQIINFWKPTSDESFIDRLSEIEKLVKENRVLHARLNNIKYELSDPQFEVRPAEELLERIYKEHMSLSRFGDGEFDLMIGSPRPWFQMPDKELSNRLHEVLNQKIDGLIIAIADNFGNLDKYSDSEADSIRIYNDNGKREIIADYLDKNRVYYDAYVTRPYYVLKDLNRTKIIFDGYKKIFRNRDILVVEGIESRFGVNNDLLDEAKQVRRIRCPGSNAFSVYGAIFKSAIEFSYRNTLVLISLGPTATVLAYDLAIQQRQALDIGQLDNEYDWYVMGKGGRIPIPGKATAEGAGNRYADTPEEYLSEVVCTIG